MQTPENEFSTHPDAGAPAEMCHFDFGLQKAWIHHPPLTASRKYFIGVYPELWPTLNTHCPSSVHSGMANMRQKAAGHTEAGVSFLWLFVRGESSFSYTNRDIHVEWQACVCVIDGCRLSTNDTLSESQQDGRRSSRPLCSARLCQHQLKEGIFNPNTSLTQSTAGCKQRDQALRHTQAS